MGRRFRIQIESVVSAFFLMGSPFALFALFYFSHMDHEAPISPPIVAPLADTTVKSKSKPISPSTPSARRAHAEELLGRYWEGSRVQHSLDYSESLDQKKAKRHFRNFLADRIREASPPSNKKNAKKLADLIIRESRQNDFDPLFLYAVIRSESSFHPKAVGSVGEIGLMQIRPETAKWVSGLMKRKWQGEKSLFDPKVNLAIGTFYLKYLRNHFDRHSRLYLAAYNMGSGSVKRVLKKDYWPKDYPYLIMKRYLQAYRDLANSQELDNLILTP